MEGSFDSEHFLRKAIEVKIEVVEAVIEYGFCVRDCFIFHEELNEIRMKDVVKREAQRERLLLGYFLHILKSVKSEFQGF